MSPPVDTLQPCPSPPPVLFHSTLRIQKTAGRPANASKDRKAAGGVPDTPVLIEIFPHGKRIADGDERTAKKNNCPYPNNGKGS